MKNFNFSTYSSTLFQLIEHKTSINLNCNKLRVKNSTSLITFDIYSKDNECDVNDIIEYDTKRSMSIFMIAFIIFMFYLSISLSIILAVFECLVFLMIGMEFTVRLRLKNGTILKIVVPTDEKQQEILNDFIMELSSEFQSK